MNSPVRQFIRAFTLIELLVVVAIVLVLATLAMPAFNSIAVGSNLNRSGQLVGDQIALARLNAVTGNREVQVRLYNMTNGITKGWRGIQVWRVEQTASGPTNIPSGRLMVFPEGIVMDPDKSPLLAADPNVAGTVTLPSHGTVTYSGFRFRPNGSTDSSISASNNYLTLQQANTSPSNYYTVQINPITGKTTIFRP